MVLFLFNLFQFNYMVLNLFNLFQFNLNLNQTPKDFVSFLMEVEKDINFYIIHLFQYIHSLFGVQV